MNSQEKDKNKSKIRLRDKEIRERSADDFLKPNYQFYGSEVKYVGELEKQILFFFMKHVIFKSCRTYKLFASFFSIYPKPNEKLYALSK